MRVFIYELDGARLPAADTATRRALFGPPMDWRGNTFASGPMYMDAVLSRLLPNRTLNPALADLFFLHQMQRVIAMNAHRLVYAFDDAPSERVDAMSLLMQLVLPSSAG